MPRSLNKSSIWPRPEQAVILSLLNPDLDRECLLIKCCRDSLLRWKLSINAEFYAYYKSIKKDEINTSLGEQFDTFWKLGLPVAPKVYCDYAPVILYRYIHIQIVNLNSN